MASCELGVHCNDSGKIQVYLRSVGMYCCLRCVAGEENTTQLEVVKQVRVGVHPIEWATSRRTEADEYDPDAKGAYRPCAVFPPFGAFTAVNERIPRFRFGIVRSSGARRSGVLALSISIF